MESQSPKAVSHSTGRRAGWGFTATFSLSVASSLCYCAPRTSNHEASKPESYKRKRSTLAYCLLVLLSWESVISPKSPDAGTLPKHRTMEV